MNLTSADQKQQRSPRLSPAHGHTMSPSLRTAPNPSTTPGHNVRVQKRLGRAARAGQGDGSARHFQPAHGVQLRGTEAICSNIFFTN